MLFRSPESSFKPLEDEWPVQEFTYLACWHNIVSTFADRRESVESYWQKADPTYIDGPGSESFEDFIKRVHAFKARLECIEYDTIAVFSHEQFISAFLWLLGKGEVMPTSKEMRDFRKYLLENPIPNGAIVQAKFHEGYGWSFEPCLTDHLRLLELEPALSAG